MENFTDNRNVSRGNCSFVVSAKARIYQTIDLKSYSLLINTNSSQIFFSAFASCPGSYFEIHIYRSNEILHDLKNYSGKKFSC